MVGEDDFLINPQNLKLEVRTVTPGLRAARLLLIPMVAAPHGGGAFSGKDPTKVDDQLLMPPGILLKILLLQNSLINALYRYICDRCSGSCSVYVNTYGTGPYYAEQAHILAEGAIMSLTPRHSSTSWFESAYLRAKFRLWPFWSLRRSRSGDI